MNIVVANQAFVTQEKAVITIGDVDFRISVSSNGDLVINKFQTGEGESSITITPSVSNEIKIR